MIFSYLFYSWDTCFVDLPALVDSTLLLLREKAACQQVEDESDDDDDDAGHDEVLMDAVSDLLPAFAKCMGSHFEPVFANFFEPLMKFAVGINNNSIQWHNLFHWNWGAYFHFLCSVESFTSSTGQDNGSCQSCWSSSRHGCPNRCLCWCDFPHLISYALYDPFLFVEAILKPDIVNIFFLAEGNALGDQRTGVTSCNQ